MTRTVSMRLAADLQISQILEEFPLLLSEKQAAVFLGVSLPFLRRGRSRGTTGHRTPTPPFVRVGGRVYYRRADLEAWVAGLTSREVV
jgi:hypothetical protein